MPDAVAGSDRAMLRAAALARRDALSAAARADGSARLADRVAPLLLSIQPKVVGAYVAFGSEADPAAVVAALQSRGVELALPAMVDAVAMVFRRYRNGDPLVPDAMRILAPAPGTTVVVPDLLLVPVTAFDRTGARLGKGRGVYDRAIAAFRKRGLSPVLVGIAFSVQEVPAIRREPHDVGLDWIVTEKETLGFPKTP